jgi:L-alanine-DL-glutamate epimerase and related enzymes of enolase superfamily
VRCGAGGPVTRIDAVGVEAVTYPLAAAFPIASGTQESAAVLRVTLRDSAGHVGVGEAAPVPHIVGHDQRAAREAALRLAPLLEGADPTAIRPLHRQLWNDPAANVSAIHAIEMALIDLCCRALSVPMATYLGGPPREVRTDMTVPMVEPQAAAARAASAVAAGFTQLKVKTGGGLTDDIARVRAVADAAPAAELTIDANQGWTTDEVVAFADAMGDAAIAIKLLEQPLPAGALAELAQLRAAIDLPVAVDEAVFTPADAHAVIAADAADIIVLKLAKAGVIGALDIAAIARGAGVELMMGCMVESAVGIHASAHVVAGLGEFMHVDLDGNQLLADDVVDAAHGPTICPVGPGHGIPLDAA